MVNQLKLINIKHGFSLLEVVISLFIISITFLAYSELIDQNLKAQDQKQQFLIDHQLKSNLLTIYVSDSNVDDYLVREMFEIDSISNQLIGRYNSLLEVELEFKYDSKIKDALILSIINLSLLFFLLIP